MENEVVPALLVLLLGLLLVIETGGENELKNECSWESPRRGNGGDGGGVVVGGRE